MMRKINRIIIHHSASETIRHDSIKVITKWHLDRGFSDCGYHYYINMKGMLSIGRPINIQGAHCLEGHNYGSIGICCGGLNGITFQQRDTLIKLCRNLVDTFDIKEDDILRHRDLVVTECPAFDICWLKFSLFKGA